jgi:hypothetical protein
VLDPAKLLFSGVGVPVGTPVGRANVVFYAAMGQLAAEPPSHSAGRGTRDAGRGTRDAGRGTRDAGRGTREIMARRPRLSCTLYGVLSAASAGPKSRLRPQRGGQTPRERPMISFMISVVPP